MRQRAKGVLAIATPQCGPSVIPPDGGVPGCQATIRDSPRRSMRRRPGVRQPLPEIAAAIFSTSTWLVSMNSLYCVCEPPAEVPAT